MNATSVRTLLAVIATAAATPVWVGSVHAAETTPTTLDLTGFSGRVQLVLSPSDQVRVNTDGWQLAKRDDVLVLQQRQSYYTPAGSSCGDSVGPPRPAPPAISTVVEIAIPPSTRLLAKRFAGSLESSVALVDARLEVGAGTLKLAQLADGHVSVVGAGSATVGEAAGRLTLGVDGPGAIHVQGGRTELLKATLQGGGRIRHDGVVRRAFLTAGGDGEIRVRQVQDPVRIDQSGRAIIVADCSGVPCEQR